MSGFVVHYSFSGVISDFRVFNASTVKEITGISVHSFSFEIPGVTQLQFKFLSFQIIIISAANFLSFVQHPILCEQNRKQGAVLSLFPFSYTVSAVL